MNTTPNPDLIKRNLIYDIYQEEYPVKFESMTDPKPLAVIMKASGQILGGRSRSQDTRVLEYVNQCKTLGIPHGLYHFLTPNGIKEQADLFLSIWDKCGGSVLPPMVDVEVDLNKFYPDKAGGSIIGNQVWQDHVKLFLDLVETGTGKKCMIYTSQKYWAFVMTRVGKNMVPPLWTSQYLLWVASYPDFPKETSAPLAMPSGWATWALWQYEDQGRPNGFPANDLNTASDDFVKIFLGETPPLPPEPPSNSTRRILEIEIQENRPVFRIDGGVWQ
jgi:GH25 family lysozyme M1 (1,4-beta-N-acetylmuramidase)